MFFLFFFCLFAFFINKNFIGYNETLLLCIFFILFFIIITKFLKENVKQYTFIKILKNFYLNLLVLRLNSFFNKLLMYSYSVRVSLTYKFINKIILLKKKNKLIINNFVNYFLVIMHYFYFMFINKTFSVKQGILNYLFFYFFKKIKKNDKVFF